MPEIILEGITKRFGKSVAVDNISLTIKDHDFISLLGPSGCGKTTILRMITGFETPTEGNIFIDGNLVFSKDKCINIPPSKRGIGFLFQNYALWPHMTVFQNISFGLRNAKIDKKKINEKVNSLCTMLHIKEYLARYPGELSGGQQQRVAIARTLSTDPKILFMDEPLSNLDAKLRNEMRIELKRLHEESNATFVYVTHDQLEAMTLSTKICLLKKGSIQQYEEPFRLYNCPKNIFVADFMGNPSMNIIKIKGKLQNNILKFNFFGCNFNYIPNVKLTILNENNFKIGIRPESIILKKNKIPCFVFSTLPSGMETIIKFTHKEETLTSVIFGNKNFKYNEKVSISIEGNNIILFDKEGKKISEGSLEKI